MHSRAFSLVINQALFVLLAYTLLQAHLRLRKRQELNRRTCTSVFGLLTPTLQVVAVYYRQRFCLFWVWLLFGNEESREKSGDFGRCHREDDRKLPGYRGEGR